LDVVARTRQLLDQGATVDVVVQDLRDDGFALIESISGLVKCGMPYPDAVRAVVDSQVWIDQRDKVTSQQWISPPDPPDAETIERLRIACGDEPRIVEAWVCGLRVTPRDGPPRENTAIALVLDPALDARDPGQAHALGELTAKLSAAARDSANVRGWVFVTDSIMDRHAEQSVKIYPTE
jgi:hypothetical protein